MKYNNVIKFKVTKEQLERIRKMMEEEGYSNLSDYMRDLTLHKNSLFKEKFFEIYKKIMENG